jgi:sRNA-binding regulator protein Hfq
MYKKICIRIDEEMLKKFQEKLKRESKSMTLFLQNAIKDYAEKK